MNICNNCVLPETGNNHFNKDGICQYCSSPSILQHITKEPDENKLLIEIENIQKRNKHKEFDCIVTPTCPTPAFKIGEKTKDPLKMYLSDIYTISVNLVGIPAISIPCGFTKKGLPVGLQIITKPFNEEMLFRVAHTYEQSTPWHNKKPKL